MKEASNMSGKGINIRGIISSLIVFSVTLVVPVFSLLQFGHFFHGSDARSGAPLPVMTQREVDQTTLPPQLFEEPLITVTFDDGYESVYNAAMPLLQKYGIHTTQYVLGGTEDQEEYVSWKQIELMQNAGHEIACHTMTHADLTTLDDPDLYFQLGMCKQEMTKRFGTIDNFASPYGSSNEKTMAVIRQYFSSHRNTNGDPTNGVTNADVNTPETFDKYNIIGVTVRHDTTIRELEQLVAFARANNGWLVLTYHQADDESGSQFGVDPKALDGQLAYLSSTKVRIVTMHEALAATRLQNVEY